MNVLAPANAFFPRGNPFLDSLGVEVIRAADGVSEVDGVDEIDRGYEHIDGRLRQLGADIRRV